MAAGMHDHLRAVVIDDQLNMRKAVVRILEKSGSFIIEDFPNSREAISWLKIHSADIVITDIYMPQGDGFDILSFVRNRTMQNDIPVLFISGEATKEDIVKSVDLGVSDYILKPFESHDLVQKVMSLIEKYKNPPENIKKLRNAEHLYLTEKYQEAKKEFLQLINSGKPSAQALIGMAHIEIKLGNVTSALNYINQGIKINGMYFPAFSTAADLLISLKRKEEAIPYLVQELKINGKQPYRRIILADIYLELNNPGCKDLALGQMKIALHDSPSDEVVLLKFADIMKIMGNFEKSVHYCMKARRQNPTSTKSIMQLANMYISEGKSAKAISLFSDLIIKNTNQFDIFLCRAKIYEKMDENEKAMSDLNKIPISAPALRIEVLKAKGRIFAKMNKLPDAIAACEEVANMEPTADNLARVGLLFIRMKNYRSALGWYEQSTIMEPNHSKYIYNLGCCYEALRDKTKAIQCYEKSLKLDPKARETIVALSRIKGTALPGNVTRQKSSKVPQKAS
ncbi:response regulator [Fluviispira multicolorata]|uniref:Tetratricopeptide repeat protein n=1 Tax=Fluviispira multicolorata TaxID=2654512 RepID=A0A833JDH7_9BACT|nr:response regulator [Fluviispira multicolorata]KAB8031888.1 tetratricopeptide repeat protein [Fluviispira multicolorata]